MSKFTSPLYNLDVASPCPADWDQMYGDGRKRYCGECRLNVYNLSGMTRDEAESLIMNAEGRLCVRFYRRADGTVLTKDCPVGLAKVRQRLQLVATGAFALVMALVSGVMFASLFPKQKKMIGKLVPITRPTPQPLMGAIAPRDKNANVDQPKKTPAKTLPEVKGEIDLERLLN